MDNFLSYCELVDAKIRASDKDLPVKFLPQVSHGKEGIFPSCTIRTCLFTAPLCEKVLPQI
jgi:hypothetical protein